MIKHITKKILFASIVTSVCVISSTQTLGCCWPCFDNEEPRSSGQRQKLLEPQQKADDKKLPLQLPSLMQQPDIHSQLPQTTVPHPNSTSFVASSETDQASIKQLIADGQYPIADTFMDYLGKEDWLDQKVYGFMRDSQFESATKFEIVSTKFKGTYKLVITIGDEQEVKLIKQ